MKIKDIITIGLLLIIIVLLLKYCSGGRTVEVVKEVHDTAWIPVKKDTQYIPQPYAVYLKGKQLPAETLYDTLYLPELVTDSECVAHYNQLKDYFSRMYMYSDTIRNKYGYIAINDTITQNKIAGRGTSQNFLVPEITNTITVTQRRNQVYIGGGLLGNEKEFVKGFEFNLSLKTKRDRMIGLGYEQLFDIGHFYKIEYRHKISLRK